MLRKGPVVVGVLAVLAAGAFVFWRRGHGGAEQSPGGQTAAKSARPIAVAVATAARKDVPLDMEGLGSVIAYKTVTVRPQVSGKLEKVFFEEGQPVKRGELLAQIDPRPFLIQLHTAQANLARDEALLQGTQLNVQRYDQLTGQKYIAQQQLDDTRSLLGQYQSAVLADRAAVENAELNLSYARITSPIDGVTGVRIIDPGNLVQTSEATGIVTITQLDPIAILFTLPQDNLTTIAQRMGGPSKLKVEAFDRDGKSLLGAGELLLIDNQINQTTATIRLKAIMPNPDRKLWPNQFVKARLHVSVESNALTIPSSAIQRGPNGNYVYVVKEDGSAENRLVTVAFSLTDLSVVRSGLQEGEQVVIEGQNQLKPGAKVQVRKLGGAPGPERVALP